MRKAATISANAHIRAMQATKAGMYEYELEAELVYEFCVMVVQHPLTIPLLVLVQMPVFYITSKIVAKCKR